MAIYIALVQSKDNNDLSEHLKTTTSLINEKLTSVDEKVNKIDRDVLSKVIRNKIGELKEELNQTIQKDGEISPEVVEIKYREWEDELNEIINSINREKIVQQSLPIYFVGDKVKHAKWGIGTVTDVKGEGDGTEVTVNFYESVGIKRLLAKFAPII